MVAIAITILFTGWFVWHRQRAEGLEGRDDLKNKDIQDIEIVLAVYFGASFVREATQLFIICANQATIANGFGRYFMDFWNILDMLEILAFFLGFGYRIDCYQSLDKSKCYTCLVDCQDYRNFTNSTSSSDMPNLPLVQSPLEDSENWERWSFCYGCCLFVAWFRVLRAFYL